MTIPAPTQEVHLKLLLPILKEALSYCMAQACVDSVRGDVDYDRENDLITYTYAPTDMDADLMEVLLGVEKIWIITDASVEGAS